MFINNYYGNYIIDISAKANRPPSASGWLAISLDYGESHTFTLENFTTETNPPYSDPEGDPLNTIKITSLPVQGVIKFSGVPISVNDVFNTGHLSGGLLSYTSDNTDLDGYTDGFMTFTVSDTGSLTFTTSPKIVTFEVLGNINAAPSVVGDGSATIDLNATYVFTRASLTSALVPAYSDPEGDAADLLKIITIPIYGELRISGIPVVDGQIITFADIDLGNFTYVNTTDNITTLEGFEFQIADTGSGIFIG